MSFASQNRRLDTRALARGLRVTLLGRFGGRATAYVAQLVLGRVLGPASYGVYSLAWKIVLIVTLVASLGLEHGVVRFGAPLWHGERGKLAALVRRCLGLALMGSAVGGLALIVASDVLAERVFEMPDLGLTLRVFSFGLLVFCLLKVAAAATRTSREMSYGVLAEHVAQPASQLLFLAVLLAAGWQLVGAVVATVSSLLVGLALALVFLRRLGLRFLRERSPSGVSTRSLLEFSLPTALAGTVSLLVAWTDLVIVGIFLSDTETGVYQAASQVSIVFALVLASSNSVFTPLVANLMSRGRNAEIGVLFKISTLCTLYLSLPVFLVLVLAPETVLGSLFDDRYLSGTRAMVFLVLGQMTNVASGAVGYLLILSGRQRTWLAASSVALALNVALNVVLIPRLGLAGAAIATAVSLASLFSLGLVLVRRHLGFWPYDRRYYKALLSLAVAVPVVLAAVRWSPLDGIANLIFLFAASGLVFVAVLAITGLDDEEKEILRAALTARREDLGDDPADGSA